MSHTWSGHGVTVTLNCPGHEVTSTQVITEQLVTQELFTQEDTACNNFCDLCNKPIYTKEEFDSHLELCYPSFNGLLELCHGGQVQVDIFMIGHFYNRIVTLLNCPRCSFLAENQCSLWDHFKEVHDALLSFSCLLCGFKHDLYFPVLGHCYQNHVPHNL